MIEDGFGRERERGIEGEEERGKFDDSKNEVLFISILFLITKKKLF